MAPQKKPHSHKKHHEKHREDSVDNSDPEEFSDDQEDESDYRRGGYHPVRVGERFKNGRYVVVRKLGWGHFSTVWLVRDEFEGGALRAMKVVKSASHYTEAARDEVTLLNAVASHDPDGRCCCARLTDSFDHLGPHGRHVCMVFERLGDNLLTLIRLYDHRGIPLDVVRAITAQILVALRYLHTTCGIIHTDMKPENVMLKYPVRHRAAVASAAVAAPEEQKPIGKIAAALAKGQTLTRNQKKKLKKKMRSRGDSSATTSVDARGGGDANGDEASSRPDEDAKAEPERLSDEKGRPQPSEAETPSEAPPTPASKAGTSGADSQSARQDDAEAAAAASTSPPRGASGDEPSTASTTTEQAAEANDPVAASTSTPAEDESAPAPDRDPCAIPRTEEEWLDASPLVLPNGKPNFTAIEARLMAMPAKVVDFGNACWVNRHFTDDIQTRQYRAPETGSLYLVVSPPRAIQPRSAAQSDVILGAGYGPSADIWSLGCLVFELVTGDFLFEPKAGRDYSRDEDHLAQMTELLGRMPRAMTSSGRHAREFFKDGRLRHIHNLNYWPLDDVLVQKYKFERAEAAALSEFLTPMLALNPSLRATAGDMLRHSWLRISGHAAPEAPLPEDNEGDAKGADKRERHDKHRRRDTRSWSRSRTPKRSRSPSPPAAPGSRPPPHPKPSTAKPAAQEAKNPLPARAGAAA